MTYCGRRDFLQRYNVIKIDNFNPDDLNYNINYLVRDCNKLFLFRHKLNHIIFIALLFYIYYTYISIVGFGIYICVGIIYPTGLCERNRYKNRNLYTFSC